MKCKRKVILLFACLLLLSGVNYLFNVHEPFISWKYQAREFFYTLRYGAPSEKIYAHRCDSLGKLKEKLGNGNFAGVEMDICFYPEQGEFDVSHDVQPSIAYPLENFVQALATTDKKCWLDFKNLSETNRDAALARLDNLFAKYHIDKSRAVVESPNVDALKAFHDDGWYTSYYCPAYGSFPGREKFLQVVRQAAATGNVDAVSFPIEEYPLVKEAAVQTDLLTWDPNAKWWDYVHDENRREILADEKLKILLVGSHSRYNR